MRSVTTLFLMLILATSLVGCETVKGASEGFKKDVMPLDAWMKENMW